MVIHHDKLAYGKLASDMEELSEQDVLNMIKLLNSEEDKEEEQKEQKCSKDIK